MRFIHKCLHARCETASLLCEMNYWYVYLLLVRSHDFFFFTPFSFHSFHHVSRWHPSSPRRPPFGDPGHAEISRSLSCLSSIVQRARPPHLPPSIGDSISIQKNVWSVASRSTGCHLCEVWWVSAPPSRGGTRAVWKCPSCLNINCYRLYWSEWDCSLGFPSFLTNRPVNWPVNKAQQV